MGLQARDYWKERHDKKLGVKRDPLDRPFRSSGNELSFVTKLVITLVLLLIAVFGYSSYRSEIDRFFNGPPVVPSLPPQVHQPAPVVIAPRVVSPAPTPRAEPDGQIYRCGNTYSSTPCEGGRKLEPQVSRPLDMSVMREIYLCKDIYDRLTWESVPCSANGRYMDRIARVPANVPWDEQVAIARQQRDKAHAIAAEQLVPVASRSAGVKANAGECQALDERVNWLDSLGRIGGGGYTMDWIREERRKARDRQFRIGC